MIREKGNLYNYNLIKVLLCKCVRMEGKTMFCLGCFEKVQELTLRMEVKLPLGFILSVVVKRVIFEI
jgi:hypothetical protein